MLRIAKSLITIVAVLAIAAGATGAYFNDQKSITGNGFATGTLQLTLNHSAGKPFSVTNAYPGYWTGWERADIFNSGTLPFEAYMTLVKTSGDDVLWNELQVQLKTSGWDSDCTNGDGGEGLIYNGNINAFPAHNLVSSIAFWHLANEDDASGGPDNIKAGYSETICQKVGLLATADNSVQTKSVTFSEIVDAEQDND